MTTLDDETIKQIKYLYKTRPRNDMSEMQHLAKIAEITGVSMASALSVLLNMTRESLWGVKDVHTP